MKISRRGFFFAETLGCTRARKFFAAGIFLRRARQKRGVLSCKIHVANKIFSEIFGRKKARGVEMLCQ